MVEGEESTIDSTTGPKGLLCSIKIMGAAGTIELEPSVLEPLRAGAIEPDLLLTELVFGLSLGLRTLPALGRDGGAEAEPRFAALRPTMTVGPYIIILAYQWLRKRNTIEVIWVASPEYCGLNGEHGLAFDCPN